MKPTWVLKPSVVQALWCWSSNWISLNPWFSSSIILPLGGHLVMSGTFLVAPVGGRGIADIWWEETRGLLNILQRAGQPCSVKNYLFPNRAGLISPVLNSGSFQKIGEIAACASWTVGKDSLALIGFPGFNVKVSAAMRGPGFEPWVGKIPWRRKWKPTPVLLPGKSHGWRSLAGYRPWGCKESDTTEQLHFHFIKALQNAWPLEESSSVLRGSSSSLLCLASLDLPSHHLWLTVCVSLGKGNERH